MLAVSIAVSADELFEELDQWGPGFVATVGDDGRARLVALRPRLGVRRDGRVLRFVDAGGGTLNNALVRERVSVAFPPHAGSDGFSLIVDGIAHVDGEPGVLDVRPLSAVRHRPAP